MKRNIEPSSGSSDEDKTSVKKSRKENSGKRKSTETEITESIDGSKKRVTNCNGKVEAPLPEVKGVCTGNEDDQKAVKNETGCNVNHKNDSAEDNNSGEEITTEIEVISREAFTNGRYKGYYNTCSGAAEVEDILQEIIWSCDEETSDEDGSSREESMINDEEYTLLAETLTGLFRDIYRGARARNMEEKSISKYQVRSKTHDNMKVRKASKGEIYLYNKTRISSEDEYNSSYACGEVSDTSNAKERSDEGLGKEASDYSSDNEVRNEHHDESNNLSFGEDTTNFKSFRDISSEECDRNMYKKSNSSNSERNDEGLGKEISGNTYEENGVQSGQTNRNRKEGNSNATEKSDNFTDCQSNAKPHEECSTSETSDEESDSSTDVKMSDEEGGGDSSGDEVHDKRCSDITNDKRMKYKFENDSNEGDSSEPEGESDMSTDEEDSWSRENESSSDEETNSLGTVESDNSSEEESDDDNTEISDEETDNLGTEESDNSEEESDEDTDQSSDEVSSNYGEENSDTSSGEDDSTDSEGTVDTRNTSTDEDCSNESEDDNYSEMIDESLEEDKNTDYGDEIDSEWEDINLLTNEKRSKTGDITDDESSNSSACEERNNSTDPVAHYRGRRKENAHSGNDGASVIHGNVYALFHYRSCKEIIYSSSEEENSLDRAKEHVSSETDKDLRGVENIRNKTTIESISEVNESNAEESKSSDDTGDFEILIDNVLGSLSHRRLCIATPGQDTILVSVTQLKLMLLKDYFRESADGRHKKRVVANRKGNIITPPIKGNFRDGKSEKRNGNTINKVSVKSKAAEVYDAEEQMSDEEAEWQVMDRRGRNSRNKKGDKQIEFDCDFKENGESGEDCNEGDDEDSGEDNAKGLEDAEEEDEDAEEEEDEEDIGEEDSDEEFDEDGDEEDENDEEVEEEEDEYIEVKENDEENEEEFVEEEENEEECDEEGNELEGTEEEDENEKEDVEENVYAEVQDEDDSNEQSSENDNYQRNTKTKSRIMTKKKATKEQVRGKTNLMKRKK